MENPFVKLFAIDFKDHLEVKKSGNTELKYVSWAYACAEVKKLYPAASYEVKKFNGLPYVYDPITGFMVYTFLLADAAMDVHQGNYTHATYLCQVYPVSMQRRRAKVW